jgi:dTDP-3-amino-3,4,6-trideoxy-alpha-D-glucose transaminase
MAVPLFDIATPLRPLRAELDAAIARVIDSGSFILGPEVEAFERELGSALGSGHVMGVANGTEAITIALRALGVGPGDEVVVPSFSFYASAEAIPPTGATPVFCDIDPATFCITPETVRAALTPKTKAVIAVDLFGNVADVPGIEALGVPVLEDAAQAVGATLNGVHAGALGTVATLSFYPSKNLGALGDAGAVLTDDEELAARVRTLRFHGTTPDRQTYVDVGYNSRLDELQAAALRVLLPHLGEWAAARRAAAASYVEAGLGELATLPSATDGAQPAWHVYVIRHPRADELLEALSAAGIGARPYYRVPIHRQPAMRAWGSSAVLPATEEVAATHLALPMGATLSAGAIDEVVTAVRHARLG